MTEWEGVEDIFADYDNPDPVEKPAKEEPKKEVPEVEKEEGNQQEEVEHKEIDIDDIDGDVKEEEKKEEEAKSNTDVIKALAEYKAEKYGIDISEVESWDEDTFAALEDQIDDLRLEEKYNQAKSSNELIEALLEMAENGGDTNDVLELFEKKKEFTDIDTSTVDGKLEKIKKYYKDVVGKKPAWIEGHVKRLQLSGDEADVVEEFESVNQEYDDHFKAEKEAKLQRAKQIKEDNETRRRKQVTDFGGVLEKQKLPKATSKELTDFVFQERYKVRGTDQVLSAFDLEVIKAKNNPDALLEMTLFLKDKEAFKQRILTEHNNVKNEKKFGVLLQKQNTTSTNTEQPVKSSKISFKAP